MQTQDYKIGFSTGYFGGQLPPNASADLQAGWLDGKELKAEIQQQERELCDECPECGADIS